MSTSTSARVLRALECFLGQIHCSAQEAGLDSMIDTDLSFSQFRSLLVLTQVSEPLPIHELAEKLRLSVAATGRNVDRLVKEGLVDRQEDEADRRIKRISLSTGGHDLINSFREAQRASALGFIKALDPVHRDRLLAALEPIVAGIGPGSGESGTTPAPSRLPAQPDPAAHSQQSPRPQEQFV